MSEVEIKPPSWFTVVTILALAWNGLGVGAYIAQVTMSPEAFSALPEAQRTLMENTPAWATGAFAIAVFGGALGSLALLIRKSWAVPLLAVSLLAIAVQMYHSFFISNSFEVFGPGGLVMPLMVVVVAVYLLTLARNASNRGWIK